MKTSNSVQIVSIKRAADQQLEIAGGHYSIACMHSRIQTSRTTSHLQATNSSISPKGVSVVLSSCVATPVIALLSSQGHVQGLVRL